VSWLPGESAGLADTVPSTSKAVIPAEDPGTCRRLPPAHIQHRAATGAVDRGALQRTNSCTKKLLLVGARKSRRRAALRSVRVDVVPPRGVRSNGRRSSGHSRRDRLGALIAPVSRVARAGWHTTPKPAAPAPKKQAPSRRLSAISLDPGLLTHSLKGVLRTVRSRQLTAVCQGGNTSRRKRSGGSVKLKQAADGQPRATQVGGRSRSDSSRGRSGRSLGRLVGLAEQLVGQIDHITQSLGHFASEACSSELSL